ncbi:MAG TPA: hypothetical protein EYG82_00860 [Sulfurovum sp.]|nr:hypothetical protein [Sulfurovum sp.]
MKEKFYKIVGWISIGYAVVLFIWLLNKPDTPRQESARNRWIDIVSGDKAARENVNAVAEQVATSLMKE